ncbi:hypothetical protein M514_01759 [Trichuris suis]|uniref:Pru domain-containing protein n=1 Tax=Trichuris suis TaxID=68888 RepID=A0A085NT40_9BILA|nr:hypothetical protein M513_01759 [Trichuris suis]KFD72636.1 hypothetical protein M514_01759 [Trichuris suis]
MAKKTEEKMPLTKKIPRKRILLRFRAGKMLPKNDTLLPFNHKGVFYLYEDENGFVCHCWKDRETGLTENERMLLPGEGELTPLPQYASLRVYQLAFATESQKLYYWMQEKDKSTDELRCNVANEILNYDYKEGENNLLGRLQGKRLREPQNVNGGINVNHVLEIMRLLEQATKSLDGKNKTVAEKDDRTREKLSKEKLVVNDKTNDASDESPKSDSEDEDENVDKTIQKKKEPEIRKVPLTRKRKKGSSLSERKPPSHGNEKGTSAKTGSFGKQGILYALENGLNLLLQTIMEDSKKNEGKIKGKHDKKEHLNSIKGKLPTKDQMQKFLSGQMNVRPNTAKNVKNKVSFIPERKKQNCANSSGCGKGHFSKLIEAHLKTLHATNDDCRHRGKNDQTKIQGKQRNVDNFKKKVGTAAHGKHTHDIEKGTSEIPEKKKEIEKQKIITEENQVNQDDDDSPKRKPILLILQPQESRNGQNNICIRKLLLSNKLRKGDNKNEEQWSFVKRKHKEQAGFLPGEENVYNRLGKGEENQEQENEDEDDDEEEEEEADDDDADNRYTVGTNYREAFGTEPVFHTQCTGQYNRAGVPDSNKLEVMPYRNKVKQNMLRKNIKDSRSYRAAVISNTVREILLKDYSMNPEVKDGFTPPTRSKAGKKSITDVQRNNRKFISPTKYTESEKKYPKGDLTLPTQEMAQKKENKNKSDGKGKKERQSINKSPNSNAGKAPQNEKDNINEKSN